MSYYKQFDCTCNLILWEFPLYLGPQSTQYMGELWLKLSSVHALDHSLNTMEV